MQIAPIRTAQLFVPDDNFPIRAEDYLPDIAIDPTNGAIYVVWSDGLGTPIDRVVMAKSTDGGRHWSGPTVVSTGGPNVQAYNHAIEVTADGTVVLTYYDDRNNVLGDGIATTDIWLRHSHDGGATWEPEQHLHGPFDHYTAPISYFAPGDPRGLFLGDYMGLETIAGRQRDRLLRLDDHRRRGRPLDPREPPVTAVPRRAGPIPAQYGGKSAYQSPRRRNARPERALGGLLVERARRCSARRAPRSTGVSGWISPGPRRDLLGQRQRELVERLERLRAHHDHDPRLHDRDLLDEPRDALRRGERRVRHRALDAQRPVDGERVDLEPLERLHQRGARSARRTRRPPRSPTRSART